VDSALNLLYVKGTIPGPKGGIVKVRDTIYLMESQFDPYQSPPPFPTRTAEEIESMAVEQIWSPEIPDPIAVRYNMQ
jgi:hypothetical protein